MRSETSQPRLLNLGCGGNFHPDWVNIDFHDHGGAVLPYDLRLGIPFADDTFDVVYHSHVLEHFSREDGKAFLQECFRVLLPGGLLRVAVPDLENIARAYLAALDEARVGLEGAQDRHEWMTVELVDQMTRRESGGEMAAFWRRAVVPQEAFIVSRSGKEYTRFRQRYLQNSPQAGTDKKKRALLPDVDAAFLQGGEPHLWMYDEISLTKLCADTGFTPITRQAYNVSFNPDILAYGLDALPDGRIGKPDSFFLEAVKPSEAVHAASTLKIVVFSTADAGGAGIAALRHHQSLLSAGVSSQMYVAEQGARTANVRVLPSPGQTVTRQHNGRVALSGLQALRKKRAAQLARYVRRPPGLEMFSTPGQCADLGTLPYQEDFTVINLHWVADFLDPTLSLEALRGRPVVWTLHDMRPFTGGCHYAGDCRKFVEHCGACPQLGSDDPQDLSFRTWRAAKAAFRVLDLHIVTPSEWLAAEARQSTLFRRFPVRVIKHAIPLDVFKPLNKKAIRQELGIDEAELTLAFAAQSLENTRKGTAFLLKCLELLASGPLRDKIRLLLLGNNPPAYFSQLGFAVNALGHVDDPEQMALVYNAADAVLVPSLEDNSPNVICEAAGCGVPVVAFAAGGIPEMIRHRETGWLAPVKDAESLAAGVAWVDEARKDDSLRLRCRAFALEQWNLPERAREYVELFTEIHDEASGEEKG
jgi:glycosyltransferase involved in cell wall biosynthesis/predicted SAM-dependent methyltransferase